MTHISKITVQMMGVVVFQQNTGCRINVETSSNIKPVEDTKNELKKRSKT